MRYPNFTGSCSIRAALDCMAEKLPRGGKVVLLAQAFPSLFGPVTRNLRYWRYRRADLATLVDECARAETARTIGIEDPRVRSLRGSGSRIYTGTLKANCAMLALRFIGPYASARGSAAYYILRPTL
jgi:hypothetical protein